MKISKELIQEYIAFVLNKLYPNKNKKEFEEIVKKHKITSRVIEHNWKAYFTIYKWLNIIDQNDLSLFITK